MKISPAGYVRCPSCLSHVKAIAESVDCPFCEHNFACSESHAAIGGGTDTLLSKSRAGLVALGLAGIAMVVACDDDSKDPNNNTNNETNWEDPQNDYGGFPIDEDWNLGPGPEDMGEDAEPDLDEDAGEDMGEDVGDDG